jgi:hypothetical protein
MTQQAKHTPYTVDVSEKYIGKGYQVQIFGVVDGRKCTLAHMVESEGVNEVKVANLFAAAPETAAERDRLKEINAELLEALKAMTDKYGGMYDEWQEADIKARAAIARAEGRA